MSFPVRLWVNRVDRFAQTQNPRRRRNLILSDIEKAGFQKWVVFVAGAGFFMDSYALFSSNYVVPMLAYVYWNSDPHSHNDTAINSMTLAGTIVGQILFGVLGDWYGRRKMYGIELIIMMGAVLGVTMSSTGKDNSMRIVPWLMFWRFVGGIGWGGEYPLSACIVSEFAPTKHRARMMATLFLMQAFGQLAAILVSLVVIAIVRGRGYENDQVAIDMAWRWVMGVGAVPAVVALVFRVTIPESPIFTLDVLEDEHKASLDSDYFRLPPSANDQEHLAADMAEPPMQQHDPDEILPAHANGHVGPMNPVRRAPTPGGWRSWTADFVQYLRQDGNWKLLVGTAGSWLTLDFAYYGLGMNNPETIAKIWTHTDTSADGSIYDRLTNNGTRALVVVSIGAVSGGLLLIYAIDHFSRKKIQLWGFWALTALFIIIGATYRRVVSSQFHGVTITLYVICQFVFNFGPNTTTFIIPAEIFPTKFRCTCHGISAAAGKLGSVLTQVFLANVRFGNMRGSDSDPKSYWLGNVLLVFAAFMAVGGFLTWLWVPEIQDEHGRSLSLEVLAQGRARPGSITEGEKLLRRWWAWFRARRGADAEETRGPVNPADDCGDTPSPPTS